MTIYLANSSQQNDPKHFDSWIVENGIEIIQTTPSRMKMLMIDERYRTGIKTLKWIMLGGESVETELVKDLQKYTDADIENVYGPSETTVWSTATLIEDSDSITIGKPISNTQIHILSGMTQCGIGMIGELCIGGDGLSLGYLNRSELTAEKFIDNPFGEGKIYRTGDFARWLPDGNIKFLGRIDTQVKINGHRIELGEIQNRLTEIGEITAGAVIARKNRSGVDSIYAYYVSDTELQNEYIRNELRSTLPAYMVPAFIARIEKLPINQSGKLNVAALPDIEAEHREYREPVTEEEIALCNAVGKILNNKRVGINDNFYELGGDSINAVRLIYELQYNGFSLDVRDILMSVNLSETARAITAYVEEQKQEEVEIGNGMTESEIVDILDMFDDED